MGSRKKLTPAGRAARARRRAERSDRQVQRKLNDIAARELAARVRHTLIHDFGVDPNDIVRLEAEGFASKRAHTVGTPENWPTIDNEQEQP